MIQIEATQYGSGVTLWGDQFDLSHLLDTIYALADEHLLGESISYFLLGLAHEIRHAGMGNRLKKDFEEGAETISYRGVRILWPHIIMQIAMLRDAAKYKPTSANHQADLYRLESAIQATLLSYDEKAGKKCIDLMPTLGLIRPDYPLLFIELQTEEFLTETKPGILRIKALPRYLENLSPMSEAYRIFEAQLKHRAQQENCEPADFSRLNRDEVDFKW